MTAPSIRCDRDVLNCLKAGYLGPDAVWSMRDAWQRVANERRAKSWALRFRLREPSFPCSHDADETQPRHLK